MTKGNAIKKMATREAFGKTLLALGRTDERIAALNADLSGSTKTSLFAEVFGERFYNMGIAEADMMGTAAGLAAAGKIPFASTFAMFATGRAWEQVRQSICLNRFNVHKSYSLRCGVLVRSGGFLGRGEAPEGIGQKAQRTGKYPSRSLHDRLPWRVLFILAPNPGYRRFSSSAITSSVISNSSTA